MKKFWITGWMFALLFGIFLLAKSSNVFAQTEIPAGNVSGLWAKADSPYRINGEITIPNGETLTIEPGVAVVFTGHYKFNVQGRLLAVGTGQDTIRFFTQDKKAGWGGVRFINTPGSNDSSKIAYCVLKNGKANAGSDIDRCGGAVSVKSFNKLLISHCLIDSNMNSGNPATTAGGGICLWTASPTITNCELKANTSAYGAAIAVYYSSNAQICNNYIHDNTGHGTINIGGGSAPILMNNLIVNNRSTMHGNVHFETSGLAKLINNTIVNNISQGGAVWSNDSSAPTLINNIVYGNSPAQVCLMAQSSLDFFNCLIEGGTDGFAGKANFTGTYQDCIDSNPAFVSSADFHLLDVSPCIGAGVSSIQLSSKWYYAPDSDYEGNSRPNPVSSHPDLGAFENALGNPTTGIYEAEKQIPDGFQLYQNYPNPFNPSTTIRYSVPKSCFVELTVYDLLGRWIESLVYEIKNPGEYSAVWEGENHAAGVYLVRLMAGDPSASSGQSFKETRKLVLQK
jgi:hypothetical protein